MKLFVKERSSDIRKRIKFDSEAGMFYMYCSDGDMLQEVISRFVEENEGDRAERICREDRF